MFWNIAETIAFSEMKPLKSAWSHDEESNKNDSLNEIHFLNVDLLWQKVFEKLFWLSSLKGKLEI